MIRFAGWEMPVQYQSALEEHLAVRTRVGVFDVSHMGQIEIRGRDALSMTQRVTCNDISRLVNGQAQYSAFLTNQGTFLDDIVVYRFDPEHFLICVNAATREKDFKWLSDHQRGEVEIRDSSQDFSQLAIQGPASEKVLQKLTDLDLSNLKFYRFEKGKVGDATTIISRTGYTGEDGFELYLAPEKAEKCWENLFKAGQKEGITAAGLAARNTLRLEMRYPLYGNDIDESRTPFEAGLGWIVKLEKEFVGREALLRQKESGPQEKLMGFELIDKGIVRDGFRASIDGTSVGSVTSGGYSPSLKKSIGLVYLPLERAIIEQVFEIDVRGRCCRAVVVQTPFYERSN
jgi:aminomethyltransferase